MIYSQKANPNATNSEMDSKTIIKQPQLTTQQWDELIDQYVDVYVDSMDTEALISFVRQTVKEELCEIESRRDLCDEIRYTYDQDLLDELVDNVTKGINPYYPNVSRVERELTTQEQLDYINSNLTEVN
tara:strand:- start:1739 stop:2125 length:387 start_codon:yes stop_codon:yes gene_type:complete